MATKFFQSFVLVLWLFAQISLQANFPQSVISQMATRQMRYHHYLWHQVREGWNLFPESTKQAYRDIGWAPPRAARTYDSSGRASVILDNNSGEDFLYMHRQMIATVNNIIAQNNDPYGPIKGWTTVPASGDSSYPVPRSYTITGNPVTTDSLKVWKADSYYNTIKTAENTFKDPAQLRTMTLGELGARIEGTIHTWMHMRWSAASPYGYRTSYRGTIPNIDKKWDDPQYNWLGEPYASHVNPIFYKLHGWIDDRVEDWRKANGLTSIRWKGTWAGGPMSNLGSVMKESSMGYMEPDDSMQPDDSNGVGDVLEQAFQIFMKSGVPESGFDNLVTDGLIPETKTNRKLKARRICKASPKSRK